MLPEQRQAKVRDYVAHRGSASVEELAEHLAVSPSTIRRDLNFLDKEGILRRVRGGVTLDGEPWIFNAVASEMSEDRAAIGKRAAELVQDRQVVVLDIGTTAAQVARYLRHRHVTVVTSSLAVIDQLRDSAATELVVLGGMYRPSYLSMIGPLTEQALGLLSADIGFLSATGIRADFTVHDNTVTEVPIKQAIIRQSAKTYLLAIESKFPGSGVLPVCSTNDLTGVITNASPELPTLKKIEAAGTHVLYV